MGTTNYSEACQKADRCAAALGRRFGVIRYHRHDGQTTYAVWPLYAENQSRHVTKSGQIGFVAYIASGGEV